VSKEAIDGTVIRRVQAGDGAFIKDVRLRALETDPLSFGSTHSREASYSDSEWVDWATGDASGEETATLLAIRGREPVGMIAAYRDATQHDLFHVVAMWVAPEVRREGIGWLLLGGIEAWIASCGGTCIQLSVADSAAAASRLYEKSGYEADGEVSASPHTPGVTHVSLRKRLIDSDR
jgi:ribosomal protein S18 acetylase RimI-like enzyme